jgi:hypothetical protein
MRLMLPFALAALFVLAGVILDGNYQRSTPDPAYSERGSTRFGLIIAG